MKSMITMAAAGAPAQTAPDNPGGLALALLVLIAAVMGWIGLRSMAYRARLLHGELKLLPSRSGGLRVQCRLAAEAQGREAIAS